jgi:hypothetical protein
MESLCSKFQIARELANESIATVVLSSFLMNI